MLIFLTLTPSQNNRGGKLQSRTNIFRAALICFLFPSLLFTASGGVCDALRDGDVTLVTLVTLTPNLRKTGGRGWSTVSNSNISIKSVAVAR